MGFNGCRPASLLDSEGGLMLGMCEFGIDPVRQNMEALTHVLLATPGLKEGVALCSTRYETERARGF